MSLFRLEIVTPERTVMSQEATMVIAPTIDGQIGVLAGHIPLVTILDIGMLRVQAGEAPEVVLAIGGGFLEMSPDNKLTILAQTAETAAEIDVKRAEQARQRAEERLNSKDDDIDVARAEIALCRAITRLRVAEHKE